LGRGRRPQGGPAGPRSGASPIHTLRALARSPDKIRPRVPAPKRERAAYPMSYSTYASPFSWRYGRAELRALFSEERRRKLWRQVWVALAQAQAARGLLSQAELDDISAHAHEVDIEAALEIEREIHHDLMAEIRVFSSQAKIGGGKLHLGSTSMDIEDTVETYRLRLALSLVGAALDDVLRAFAEKIRE